LQQGLICSQSHKIHNFKRVFRLGKKEKGMALWHDRCYNQTVEVERSVMLPIADENRNQR